MGKHISQLLKISQKWDLILTFSVYIKNNFFVKIKKNKKKKGTLNGPKEIALNLPFEDQSNVYVLPSSNGLRYLEKALFSWKVPVFRPPVLLIRIMLKLM